MHTLNLAVLFGRVRPFFHIYRTFFMNGWSVRFIFHGYLSVAIEPLASDKMLKVITAIMVAKLSLGGKIVSIFNDFLTNLV